MFGVISQKWNRYILTIKIFQYNEWYDIIISKHKFFDLLAACSRLTGKSPVIQRILCLIPNNKRIGTETENDGRTVISLLKAAVVPLMFRAEKGGTNDT